MGKVTVSGINKEQTVKTKKKVVIMEAEMIGTLNRHRKVW